MAAGEPGRLLASLSSTTTSAAEYAGGLLPSYSPFTASLGLSLLPVGAVTVALLLLMARVAGCIQAALNSDRNVETLATGQEGKSAIEFILLAPTILLPILLLILQVSLLVQAKLVTNYAAFCAVRSAIVYIPADLDGEGRNHIDNENPGSEKMQAIRRAAAFGVIPISPHWSEALSDRTGGIPDADAEQEDAAEQIAEFFATTADDDLVESFKRRWAYAFNAENTRIELVPEPGSGSQESGQYGDHDPVTVLVTHRYYLGIPLANRLLGTSYGGAGTSYYYTLTEQYTLLNEGEPLFPES
jgi:hypothetical protein